MIAAAIVAAVCLIILVLADEPQITDEPTLPLHPPAGGNPYSPYDAIAWRDAGDCCSCEECS